jgi:hypothetical protein
MELMHRERVSHNAVLKPLRTRWQDSLITQVTQMAISPYIDVRRCFISLQNLIVGHLKEFYT